MTTGKPTGANLEKIDRVWRWCLGVSLLTWAVAGGPLWTYLGLYPLVTASFGFCPAYFLLKINS
jgi:hypothetical protein